MAETFRELADLLDEAAPLVHEDHDVYYRLAARGVRPAAEHDGRAYYLYRDDPQAIDEYEYGGTPTPCACAIGALYHISLVHDVVKRIPILPCGDISTRELYGVLKRAHPVLRMAVTNPATGSRDNLAMAIDYLHAGNNWPITRIASWLRELGVEEEA